MLKARQSAMATWAKSRADAETLVDDVRRGNVRAPRAEAIFDIVMGPVADGLDAAHPVLDVAELLPRKIEELVGIAIAARQDIAEFFRRKLMDGDGRPGRHRIVRLRGNGNERIVMDDVFARLHDDTVGMVLVRVDKRCNRQGGREDQFLPPDALMNVIARPQDEEHRSRG